MPLKHKTRRGGNFLAALFLVAMALLFSAAPARAQYIDPTGAPEFSLSMGYSNVDLGSSSGIHDEGAFHWDSSVSVSPIVTLPQLRVGGDFGASFVLDNSTHTIISRNGQLIIAGSSDVPLWIFEPELRLSWRQTFGRNETIFVEPGIAGGGAFGFLTLHDVNIADKSYSADSATGYGRIFMRAGARVSGGVVCIEGSYLAGGHMDFGGNAAGNLTEYYIGVYGAIRF